MLVVVYHAGIWAGFTWGIEPDHHGLGGFLRHADVAVPVFFMISAFLLYRPFVLRQLTGRPAPRMGPYLLRRVARIAPAYWVALAVSLLLLGHATELDAWGHVRLALLIQIYWEDTATAGLAQAWSLNTELTFYLVLPLFAAGVGAVTAGARGRLLIRAHLLLCALLVALGWVVRHRVFAAGPHRAQFWLPANLDMFAVGMALAVVSAAAIARGGTGREPPRLLRLFADLPATALAVLVLCLVFLVSLDLPIRTPPTSAQELTRRVIFVVMGVVVLTPAAFGPERRGLLRRVLSSRAAAFVGRASLGIYVWHITVLDRLDQRFRPEDVGVWWRDGGLFLVTAGILVSLLLGTLSWWLVERPVLRWARGAISGTGRRIALRSGR